LLCHHRLANITTCQCADRSQASISFNGFGDRIELHRVAAGAVGAPEAICVERGGRHDTALARGYAALEVRGGVTAP
jgi:hypothetical protein